MTGEVDPYDDPFGEAWEPTLGMAHTAVVQAEELAAQAAALIDTHIAQNALAENIVAASARKSAALTIRRLAEAAETVRGHATRARVLEGDDRDAAIGAALASLGVTLALHAEAEQLAKAILTPDVVSAETIAAPPPDPKAWQTVATSVHAATTGWEASVRGEQGKLLVLKPSPSVGKTRALIDVALDAQAHGQRVVFTVATKEMVVSELERRIRQARPFVRLHVIQGRDDTTCWNYPNVRAVQAHGYSPGTTVCPACEHHPDNAAPLRLKLCPYYESRVRAQNDCRAASRGYHEYPLILSTHACYVAAAESGSGRYGKFWPCDLLLMDEDPTDAFERAVFVGEGQAAFVSASPEHRATHVWASVTREAFVVAQAERDHALGLGWGRDQVHGRRGSVYTGAALRDLLNRAATRLGQQHGGLTVMKLLRDVCDLHSRPGVGALFGADTLDAVSALAPARGLTRLAEALFDEAVTCEQVRRLVYEKAHGHAMAFTASREHVERELTDRVESFDMVYRVRLESTEENKWRFAIADFPDLKEHTANTVVADAYADVQHCRQLFGKPERLPGDPAYADPVQVIAGVARFPPETLILRVRTPSTITWLLAGGWDTHAGLLAEVLSRLNGKRVLVYGHKKLRKKIEKLFRDHGDFGVAEWAFEHWWGVRGKDQYRDFDAVVLASEPIWNLDDALHTVNARAMRDLTAKLARGDGAGALADAPRISRPEQKTKTAHALKKSASRTHHRILQEHERRNVGERDQAMHRVRGLISPKTIVVFGSTLPFSRESIGATVTVSLEETEPSFEPLSVARDSRGMPLGVNFREMNLLSEDSSGCLTEDEVYEAMLAVEDRFGCWSPSFFHALLSVEVLIEMGGFRDFESVTEGIVSGATRETFFSSVTHNRGPEVPGLPATVLDRLGGAAFSGVPTQRGGRLTHLVAPLIERVHEPPPRWQSLSRSAARLGSMTRAASRIASDPAWARGPYRPKWWPKGSPGRACTWYSRRGEAGGRRAFAEIIDYQYGINRNGVLYAPDRRPIVPF